MALYFDTAGQAVKRTTGLPSASGNYTAAWLTRIDAQASYRTLFYLGDDPVASYADFVWLGAYGAVDPTQYRLQVADSVLGLVETVKAEIPEGTWVQVAYVRTGTTHRAYINGVQLGSDLTLDWSGATVENVFLGDDAYSTSADLWVQHFREWSAALSTNELAAERYSATAVRTADLLTDTPLTTDLLDDSGNSHTWSLVGSPAFTADADALNNTFETSFTPTYQQYVSRQASVGVSGSYGIDWDGGALPSRWESAGFDYAVTPLAAAGFSVTASYQFVSSRLTDGGAYGPLVAITRTDPITGLPQPFVSINATNADSWGLPGGDPTDIYVELDTIGGADPTYFLGKAATLADGAFHTIKLCVTFSSSAGASDAVVKFYLDSTQVLHATGQDIDPETVTRVMFGHDGLFGVVDNIIAYDNGTQCGTSAFYDCTTPGAGEDLCDKRNVTAFLLWDVTEATTVRYAAAALDFPSTYYGGFMAPRVLRWGPVTRALSDLDGQWEAARFSVELADTDRAIRNYVNTEPVRGTALRAYLISAEGRATAATPRVLFAGPLVKWRPTGDLKMELHGADQLALVLGGLWGKPERLVPSRVITATDFPNAPAASMGKPVPIIYGWVADWKTAEANASGMCPLVYTGTRVLSDSQSWHEWVVAGHACKAITRLCVDNVDANSAIGSTWLVPGYSGYTTASATTYRDFNGRRYTTIYGRGSDPDAVAGVDISGTTVTPTKVAFVNVKGCEETGDGTGDLIDDLFKQYVHFLINWALQEYQSGDWLDMTTGPLYDTGWCVLNVQSWLDAQALAMTRVDGGYLGVSYIGPQAKNVRDWIRDFNVSGGVRLGLNEFCQWTLSFLNPNTDPTGLESFSDVEDIHNASVDLDVNADAIVTRVTASAFRLPKGQVSDPGPGWQSDWKYGGAETFIDTAAETDYGEVGVTLELPFVSNYDPTTLGDAAQDVAQRWLDLRSAPRTTVTFRTGLCGLRADLGDIIKVNHFAGVSTSGWVDRLVQVERLVIDAQEGTVTISGRDVTDLVSLASASVSPTSSASASQSPSHSTSPSSSVSISPSSSRSPSESASPSSSTSPTSSPSSSRSPSSSVSSSISPTSSTSPSSSSSASQSPSSSASASLSPSASASPSTP